MALPALVAVGAIAGWQFTQFDAAPASAHGLPARALGPLVTTASSEPAVIRALRMSGHPTPGARGSAAPTPAASGGSSQPAGSSAAPAGSSQAGATGQPSADPTPSSSASAAFTCAGNTPAALLPENYGTIVTFLVANGYTPVAAAGITGNIYQESGGDPEAVGTGGGGLIGWTPLPAGFVTGNAQADLQTQLQAILTFNQQWAQYIPLLNDTSSPAQAAYVYMTDFERPGVLAASNREDAAAAVAQACGIGS